MRKVLDLIGGLVSIVIVVLMVTMVSCGAKEQPKSDLVVCIENKILSGEIVPQGQYYFNSHSMLYTSMYDTVPKATKITLRCYKNYGDDENIISLSMDGKEVKLDKTEKLYLNKAVKEFNERKDEALRSKLIENCK